MNIWDNIGRIGINQFQCFQSGYIEKLHQSESSTCWRHREPTKWIGELDTMNRTLMTQEKEEKDDDGMLH
jgi:hypothetical protein